MPTLTLLQNLTAPWQQNLVSGQYFNLGPQFYPEHDGEIQGISWYRHTVGTLRKPNRLQLWDVATQTKLEETTNPPDTEAVGWNTYTFAAPVPVLAGQVLCVCGIQPLGNTQAYLNPGSRPNPPNGLAYPAYDRRYIANAITFPTGQDVNSFFHQYDVVYYTDADVVQGGNVATVGDLRLVLGEWLSLGDGIHPTDSVPYLNSLQLTDIKGKTEQFEDAAITYFNEVMPLVGLPLNTSLTATLFGRLKLLQELTEAAQVVIDTINPALTQTEFDVIAAIDTHICPPSPRDTIPVGGIGWTMTDQTVGQGGYAHRLSADAYTLTVEEVGGNARTQMLVDDVGIFYMRGFAWWLNGQEVGHRQELNALVNVIRQPGSRYPGVLIDVPTDVEWTLKSWDYTG